MDDLISRQAAIDRINKQREHLQPDVYPQDEIGDAAYRICSEFIERLPSAERKGTWIKGEKHYYKDDDQHFYYYEIRCSECGAIRKIGWTGANFCPNCGADMRGEEDE